MAIAGVVGTEDRAKAPGAAGPRAHCVPTESERDSRSLFCRIFFAEPGPTSAGKCSRSAWWRRAVIWMFRLFYLAVFAVSVMALLIIPLVKMHASGESILQVAKILHYAVYALFVLGGGAIISALQYSDAFAAEFRERAPGATEGDIRAALTAAPVANLRAIFGMER